MPGSLTEEALTKYVDSVLSVGESEDDSVHASDAYDAVVLAAELNQGVAIDLAADVAKRVSLEESQKNQFNSLFSHDPKWKSV